MQSSPVIIISRTDSIGDVVLTLPMAGIIKQQLPNCKIIFLGRNYTKDVIALSKYVDEFVSYDDVLKLNSTQQINFIKQLNATHIIHVFPIIKIAFLAKQAGIKNRVGTTNRVYHWLTCNIKIKLSRKNSNLHEAQLNIKLLQAFNIKVNYTLNDLINFYGFTLVPKLNSEYQQLLSTNKKNVILHPKSKGSAREWGLTNFSELIKLLPANRYTVFVSGTEADGKLLEDFLLHHPQVINLTGKLSLRQFIAFINNCDALVAASTGPLHIAAALGKKAIGLYAPMQPIHPGRWQAIGKKANYLVIDKTCSSCRKNSACFCITQIKARDVVQMIN